MLSSAAQWLFVAQLFALGVAHRDLVLQGLSKCWQQCLASTGEGCDSRSCICETSGDNSAYLPGAVECGRAECNSDTWELDLFLAPLQLYCEAIDCAIPDDIMADASAAASDNGPLSTTTTRYSNFPTKTNAPKPTGTNGNNDLTSTITTTYTKTMTDSDGNILQIIVPIVFGPTGINTGSTITSTLGRDTCSTDTPSSTAASPSSIARAFGEASTQGASSTSAPGSEETKSPVSGNGSPFENMQAGAGRWTVSIPPFGLSALAVFFLRL